LRWQTARSPDRRCTRRDHRLAGVGDGQRHKVIGAVAERRRKRGRHRPHRCSTSGSETGFRPRLRSEFVGAAARSPARRLLRVPKFDLCAAAINRILDDGAAKMTQSHKPKARGKTVLAFRWRLGLLPACCWPLPRVLRFFASTTVASSRCWPGTSLATTVSYADSYRYAGLPLFCWCWWWPCRCLACCGSRPAAQ